MRGRIAMLIAQLVDHVAGVVTGGTPGTKGAGKKLRILGQEFLLGSQQLFFSRIGFRREKFKTDSFAHLASAFSIKSYFTTEVTEHTELKMRIECAFFFPQCSLCPLW
jgi:hypothetical protein